MAKTVKKTKKTTNTRQNATKKRATAPKPSAPAQRKPAARKMDKPGKKKGRQTIIIIR